MNWGLSPFPEHSASSAPMADSVCLLLPGSAELQQKTGKDSYIGKEISLTSLLVIDKKTTYIHICIDIFCFSVLIALETTVFITLCIT